ncbi:MAG: hypothetical protein Q9195_008197 [Heterodermia aff. obscurata]
MPEQVRKVAASDLKTSGGQTDGMIRQGAIVDMSDKLCASVMLAKPYTASAIHHHGEQDTVVYAASGHGAIVSEGGKKRQALRPGDFALIPAFAEHQEVNDGEEEVVWIITRSGRNPIVENLEDWATS